jgi:hypothetical protein
MPAPFFLGVRGLLLTLRETGISSLLALDCDMLHGLSGCLRLNVSTLVDHTA